MKIFGWRNNNSSGFSSSSTAEEVTLGIDGSALTAIITGGSSGIGAETTRVLAMRDVHVIMAVRNVKNGMAVKESLLEQIPNAKIDVMELDLSSLASVKDFASHFISLNIPLNILINNAGVFTTKSMVSKDNIELNFAVNHLGHFLLTNLLLETMKTTAKESNIEGRIINVSSTAQSSIKGIPFDEINSSSFYNRHMAYPRSKLANILHANQLAKFFKDEEVNITANSVHPGIIYTNIFRRDALYKVLFGVANKFLLKNVEQGAATTCYVALHPENKGVSGQYFENCKIVNAGSYANNAVLAKQLWDYSLNLCKLNI